MSQQPTSQPDLDDRSSVLTDAAAAQRENHMFTEGAEPLSIWFILGSAIVVLIGGGVLFGGGNLFNYTKTVKPGYERAAAEGEENSGPKPKPAMVAYNKVGGKIYSSCAGCHGNDGIGTDAYPPLANSEWVNGPSLRPAMIILNGCKDPITVAGKTYNGVMPAQGSGMGAKELAGILNYIRNNFGNKNDQLITLEMAQDALDASKERNGGAMTATELDADYKRDLKGEPLDPATMVNPKTLQPVAPASE
ncbi:cytochrome c [Verrucomicrobiaceae bacterium N1E253]|uniref:Cytochrome c n=1 Tax=Oceaniferula marina TaxID=2748318 RepID=A0A851GKH0_9BACT|nr:c-type cytochrome [Oceaniferula marina]NWK55220.1 cytochrome c [Oceaniferula marina]